ncbi:unnamed protein product [Urochloa humidicola]
MCEHYYTRVFITRLQPFFKLGHRTSVTGDCLKLYELEKSKLYEIFNANASRISITSDLWTATEMSCYMSMTAHYIDADWKLHKKIIGFVHIEGPHNGENVGQELIKRLYDWNLDRKLFSFVLDNSSVNDVVIRDLLDALVPKKVLRLNGDLFHVRCAAHILNLIVQDGLKSIQNVIKNVRETVKYVKGSTIRKEKFKFYAAQVNAPNLSLVLDTPTRWNSTYNMLETAYKFREAFTRMQERDSSYKLAPSDDDWKNVSIVRQCLKVFYEVTKRVSGTKYPTASLYFNDFCSIYLLLREWEHNDNSFVAAMAKPMLEKFEKYWGITNKLLTFATILDPRYKLKSIEYFYRLLYGEFLAEVKVDAIKKSLAELFSEYASQATRQGLSSPTVNPPINFDVEVDSVESSMSLSATRKGLSRFIQESSSNQQKRSELEVYLDDPSHPEMDNFDIIAWWKLHGPKYTVLSLIARDILSVPVSTVASESAFSLAGLVLDENRCSLLPETVEALICTQDWLRDAIPVDPRMATEDILPAESVSPSINPHPS